MPRMTRALVGPALIGIVGTAVLIGLGIWQLQRLEWKEALIAEIEARLAAEPAALPGTPDPERDNFLRVRIEGKLAEGALYRLTTIRPHGPGYQVIVPVALDGGRRVMADLGYIRQEAKGTVLPPPGRELTLTGALFWPDGADSFTPEPDREENIWFARDVAGMSEALGTEPVLVVAERHSLGEWPMARRVAHNLPNDHLGYAITWFSLAAIWAVMTVFWARKNLGGARRTARTRR